MLYPYLAALGFVVIVLFIAGMLVYMLRTDIAHFIGSLRKQASNVQKEVVREYHRGLEEEEK